MSSSVPQVVSLCRSERRGGCEAVSESMAEREHSKGKNCQKLSKMNTQSVPDGNRTTQHKGRKDVPGEGAFCCTSLSNMTDSLTSPERLRSITPNNARVVDTDDVIITS